MKIGSNNAQVKLDIKNIYKEINEAEEVEENDLDSDISSDTKQDKDMLSPTAQELFYKLLMMFIIKPGLDFDENEYNSKASVTKDNKNFIGIEKHI